MAQNAEKCRTNKRAKRLYCRSNYDMDKKTNGKSKKYIDFQTIM